MAMLLSGAKQWLASPGKGGVCIVQAMGDVAKDALGMGKKE